MQCAKILNGHQLSHTLKMALMKISLILRTSLVFLHFFIVIGCSHNLPFNSEIDCRGRDWFEVGRQDSAIGLTEENFFAQSKTCTKLDKGNIFAKYKLGYDAGLAEYCTAESGFALGRSGQDYAKVCPESLAPEFLRGFHRGLQVYFLDNSNQKLSDQLNTIRQQITSSTISDVEKRSLKNRTATLLNQKAKIEVDIKKLQEQL